MNRLPSSYFDRVYAESDDPWGFETRWYEQRKYALSLAALPRARYGRVFEPGCSGGVLTALLAERCDELVATEPVPAIAEKARQRVSSHAHVQVLTQAIPDAWPEGSFDLVVLSEVAYYLTPRGFEQMLERVDDCVPAGAHVLAVHWTGPTDYPLTGREVHERLDRHRGLRNIASYTEYDFTLSVYEAV